MPGEADPSDGREAPGNVDPPAVLGSCEAAPPPAPSRLPIRTLKLCSSLLSSFNRFSFPSLAPSRAFGILSFSALTSSLIRRVSSSLRRVEDFSSETTLSTSRRAASSRSVRASSADFSAAVSEASWSMRANARENCSSMLSLSCWSCGGVGGAMRGAMYRYSKAVSVKEYGKINADHADADLGDEVQSISHATHHCGHDKPVTPIPLGEPSGLSGQ